MADNAEAVAASERPGWIQSALDGITMSLDLINQKRIKIIVNGGCLDPRGMAKNVDQMVPSQRRLYEHLLTAFRQKRKG